jgi:pSer/pThr/pTyr-binding forkhead associated (FHA) protein
MNVRLKVLSGGSAGKEVKLQEGEFFIGRGDGCHLRPKSDAISRKHCVLLVDDKHVLVRDLQSRNGTLVNGEKIEGDRELRRGDRLTVGPLEFEVMVQSARAGAPPVPSKPAAEAAPKPAAAPVEKSAAKPVERPVEKNVPKTAPAGAGAKQPVAAKKPQGDEDLGDEDIFGWLSEGDEVDREERMTDPATRQFRMSGIKKKDGATEGETVDISNAEKSDTKAAKKKKEYGKLPPVPEAKKTDNSQQAAAEALKQFFKRS